MRKQACQALDLDRLFHASINEIKKIRAALSPIETQDITTKHPGFIEYCNNICCLYLYNYLKAHNVSQNTEVNLGELKKCLNLLPQYNKFYSYMLSLLEKEGWIEKKGDITFNLIKKNLTFSSSDLINKFPEFTGTLKLLNHCVSHYPEALSGHIPAISVLYPEGKTTFIEELLSKNTAEYSEMPVLRKMTAQLIGKLEKKRPLKILEVGGGRGIFTKNIIQHINNTEYHFTDVSRRFVIDMERYIAKENIGSVTCSQFDITRTPDAQNLTYHSYDIVIALDVVHATPQLQLSLSNLKSLLTNNGMLLLLETTQAPYWQNLIMGISTGWWSHDDQWRSLTPLINPFLWESVLRHSGFNLINTTTLNNKNSDAALIFAT